MKGVTASRQLKISIYSVSIHTPNEGSDSGFSGRKVLCESFNPHSQ